LFVYCSAGITFSTLSDTDIINIGETQVWKDSYYDAFRKAVDGGVLDPRLVQSIFWILLNFVLLGLFG